jgi:hypothetical protein
MVAIYFRVHGLKSEKSQQLNGCVGVLNEDDNDVGSSTRSNRVRVLIDGEVEEKSLKRSNLTILADGDDVNHYTLSCSFDPNNVIKSRWAILLDDDKPMMAGYCEDRGGYYFTTVKQNVMALISAVSWFTLNTPTVIHISDLNTVLCLNRLVAGTPGFLEHLQSQEVPYIKTLIPNFEQVIVLIKKNPHLTFFKWTPHQVSPVISMPDATGSMEGHCINGLIVDGKDCMEENAASRSSFPAQCTYFPPLPMHPYNDEEMPKVLTAIFRGIYLIDPSATVENCFNVIYSVDGTKTIRMGSFMDLGFASITECTFTPQMRFSSMQVASEQIIYAHN